MDNQVVNNNNDNNKESSFPYKHSFILSLVLLASAISLSGLFPYVGIMVVDLKVATSIDTSGFYAGYIAASMMFGRLTSSIFWGSTADRIGRKPVICVGCMSMLVFSLMFGLSTSYWMAIASRYLLGLFNPVVGIAKTIVSEICSKEHESYGMGIITGSWSLGLIIGPAIGGLLAHPVKNYPTVFHHNQFLTSFPYFLPNLVTAFVAFVALVLFTIDFPETLQIKRPSPEPEITNEIMEKKTWTLFDSIKSKLQFFKSMKLLSQTYSYKPIERNDPVEHYNREDNDITTKTDLINHQKKVIINDEHVVDDDIENMKLKDQTIIKPGKEISPISSSVASYAPSSSSPSVTTTENFTLFQILIQPGILKILVTYMLLSTISIGFDEAFPLWAMSTTEKGGLNISSPQVGNILSVTGAMLVVFTVVICPRVTNYYGTQKTFLIAQLSGAPLVIMIPVIRNLQDLVHLNSTTSQWLIMTLFILFKMSTNLAFSTIALIINQSVPSNKRASINGLAMTLGSFAKGIGPIICSIILAWSINDHLSYPLNYHLLFIVLAIASVISFALFLSHYRRTIAITSQQNISKEEGGEEENIELIMLSKDENLESLNQ
jgi:MFS family permease